MTNQAAIGLALAILTFLVVDYTVYDLANSLFLTRKLLDFIEWLKFWR